MRKNAPSRHETRTRRGFTLPEAMVAISLSSMVIATVMTAFIWTGRQTQLCARVAWSQAEAMRTSKKIEAYLRNAAEVTAIDETAGNWIQVRFQNGSTGILYYYNTVSSLRNGKMYLIDGWNVELLVARGLTRLMDSQGGNTPMFRRMGSNAIRVAYRVSDPTAEGTAAADDGLYAAVVDFAVCMRNVE